MSATVESMCHLLTRSRLLPADEVQGLFQRWRAEAPAAADDPARFGDWLVAAGAVTPYQVGRLLQGKAGPFVLNDYHLLDRIGQGRTCIVYKATHPLGVTVAVKVLPPARAANSRQLARFQREGRLAARLQHPNVVRTYHAGQCDDLHFLVMEFLDGETLADVLKRRRCLPPGEAVRLVHQALLGLAHVHTQGVVHRDLTPANLMLTPAPVLAPSDSTLKCAVKIFDFGLCRPLKEEAAPGKPARQLTQLGTWVGTPDYLAPEQVRDAHGAGVQADIYSLGCVLYHCLAGEPPFADTAPLRLLKRQIAEAPRPLREVNPDVAEDLQHIVDGMLAKGLAFRYPSAERVAEALQRFLPGTEDADEPTTVLLPPPAPVAVVLPPPPGAPELPAPQAVPLTAAAPAAEKRPLLDGRSRFLLGVGASLGVGAVLLIQWAGWKLLLTVLLCLAAGRYLFPYLFRKALAALEGGTPASAAQPAANDGAAIPPP